MSPQDKLHFYLMLLALFGVPAMAANGEIDRMIGGLARLWRWVRRELLP